MAYVRVATEQLSHVVFIGASVKRIAAAFLVKLPIPSFGCPSCSAVRGLLWLHSMWVCVHQHTISTELVWQQNSGVPASVLTRMLVNLLPLALSF
jgi:hypothetical protein